MPQHVDDAYEIYVDGTKIGSFGNLNGWPLSYLGQPQLFPSRSQCSTPNLSRLPSGFGTNETKRRLANDLAGGSSWRASDRLVDAASGF